MLYAHTRNDYHTLLDAVTLRQADQTPAIIYIETGQPDRVISREQFKSQASQYAAALHRQGIKSGEVVIIAHTQNLESIFLFWGALMLGAVPSMFPTLTEKLDPDIYTRSMAVLVQHAQARAVLTTDAFAPTLRHTVACPVYGSDDLTPGEWIPDHAPNPESVAFLQHSSGTTGLQKGVALSHHAVLNQLAHYSDAIALTSQDVIVSWLPLYHDMGLIAGFLMPLIQGVPLVLMSPFDWVKHPAMLPRAISQYAGTLCWLPNFAYNHMARRIRDRDIEGLSMSTMRMFINCSEPVYEESHSAFVTRFAPFGVRSDQLAVSYAMAENTFAVTQTPPGQPPYSDIVHRVTLETEGQAIPVSADHPDAVHKVSCGPPITGSSVRVIGPDAAPLTEREVGELAVKSTYMLTEYHQRPDLNPFTNEGWYLTGDMGYVADGEVYVIGRKKDLIINAGKNVYPQDIEAIVNSIAGVVPGRAVAFGVPDEREGTELIAVVAEVNTDAEAERKRINRDIRGTVSARSTVTVSYVTLVDNRWLIKTSSGKIARAANRDKWLRERGL